MILSINEPLISLEILPVVTSVSGGSPGIKQLKRGMLLVSKDRIAQQNFTSPSISKDAKVERSMGMESFPLKGCDIAVKYNSEI